jgi:hypothetical protein
MKTVLLFTSKIGSVSIELLNENFNFLIGDRVDPYGGWLIPIDTEDKIPQDDNELGTCYDWEVVARNWGSHEDNDYEPVLYIKLNQLD